MAHTYTGQTQVRSGYYVDARSFELVNVHEDGGTLPGGTDRKYVRIPVLLAMLAAPALGGLFVVAFPLIGLGVIGQAVFRAITGTAKEVAATVATPAMPAGSTALTGKPTEAGATGEPSKEAATDALAKEIQARREHKR